MVIACTSSHLSERCLNMSQLYILYTSPMPTCTAMGHDPCMTRQEPASNDTSSVDQTAKTMHRTYYKELDLFYRLGNSDYSAKRCERL